MRVTDDWPRVTRLTPSPMDMRPGTIVVGRTRWGLLRRLRLRVVVRSSRGRTYVIGHNDHGICHRIYAENIVHTEPPR